MPPDADTGQAADTLARLAAAFHERLTEAAAQADTPDDEVACHEAGQAAGRIRELMTR